MNVKVNKGRLIAAIEAKRAEVIRQTEESNAEARDKFTSYKAEVITKVKDLLAIAKGAKKSSDITEKLRYGLELKLPGAPNTESKPNTKKFDEALAQLALVEDEVIPLNQQRDADFLALI